MARISHVSHVSATPPLLALMARLRREAGLVTGGCPLSRQVRELTGQYSGETGLARRRVLSGLVSEVDGRKRGSPRPYVSARSCAAIYAALNLQLIRRLDSPPRPRQPQYTDCLLRTALLSSSKLRA